MADHWMPAPGRTIVAIDYTTYWGVVTRLPRCAAAPKLMPGLNQHQRRTSPPRYDGVGVQASRSY